jgi:hypothetical protein
VGVDRVNLAVSLFHTLASASRNDGSVWAECVIRYDRPGRLVIWTPDGRCWEIVARELAGAERPEAFVLDEG